MADTPSTCKFAEANGYIDPEEWREWTQRSFILPVRFAQTLRIAAPQVFTSFGYRPTLQTAYELADEYSKEQKVKVAIGQKCVLDQIGSCTGRGSIRADKLDDQMVRILEKLDKGCRTYMSHQLLPTSGNLGIWASIRTNYSYVLHDIMECVADNCATQMMRKKKRVRTGEVVDGEVCIQKISIRNDVGGKIDG